MITLTQLCPGSRNRSGSPMGRSTHGPDDLIEHLDACNYAEAMPRARHVPINAGGYDRGGAYWGTGQALYCLHVGGMVCKWRRLGGGSGDRRAAAYRAAVDMLYSAGEFAGPQVAHAKAMADKCPRARLHTVLAWLREVPQ